MIRKLEDLTPLEKLSLINISYSRLDTYLSCQAKYFYTYISQDPRVFGPAASLGSAVHTVLENADFEEPLNPNELHRGLEQAREMHDPDHLIPNDLMDAGYEMLTEFVDRHINDEFNVIAKEMPFELVIGPALVSGYIDRIDGDDNGVRVIDYKSGKWEATYKGISQNLQLGIYALAASVYFPGRPVRADLYYLRSGKMKGHNFSAEDLIQVETRVLEVVDDIINSRNFHETQNKNACRICDFRKSNLCATGVRRWGTN